MDTDGRKLRMSQNGCSGANGFDDGVLDLGAKWSVARGSPSSPVLAGEFFLGNGILQ